MPRQDPDINNGDGLSPPSAAEDGPDLSETTSLPSSPLSTVDGGGDESPHPKDYSDNADPYATIPKSAIAAQAPLTIPGYELLGKLGKGGMGVVYQARHCVTQRLVAIKMLREGIDSSPGVVQRFQREAEVLASLKHPNIVDFVEVGRQGECAYFVMELVTGGNLDKKLAGRSHPPDEGAKLIETLARAVQVSHEAGIIHRDLKPSNVLVTAEGAPKITDFGLAKRLDSDVRQTSTGAILGTPSYMAPEQASGRIHDLGPATDIYALGVMFYEVLTGRVPFQAPTLLETLEQVRSSDPVRPRQLRPEIPRDAETICLKCLQKDPRRRYASAAELADDLRRFQEDRPIKARRVGIKERAQKWRRRHPALMAFADCMVAIIGIAAAASLWYWNAYHRVRVEYFENIVRRHGMPEGIGPLTTDEVSHSHFAYQVFKRGGRVEEMRVINGLGQPAPRVSSGAILVRESSVSTRLEFRYVYKRNQEGHLIEEEALDRNGNTLWVLHYTAPDKAYYADKQGFPIAQTESGAAYLGLTWSEEGFPLEIQFLDRNGNQRPNDEGVYGERREFASNGLITRITFLDAKGRPVKNSQKLVAGWALEYDAQGNVTEGSYFNSDGKLTADVNGFARWTQKQDSWGNLTEIAYFDVHGAPVRSKKGVAIIRWKYDEHGNRIEERYFDTGGRPTLSREHIAYAQWRYDIKGNRTEGSFFGINDLPVMCKDGFWRWTAKYDERGNQIVASYFDKADRPAVYAKGWSRIEKTFNERGNVTEEAYFGVNGLPTLSKEGFHRLKRTLGDLGLPIEFAYFGVDGLPTLCDKGYGRCAVQYDDRGKRTEMRYFGCDGLRTLSTEGGARVTLKYDEQGHECDVSYFDADNRLTPCTKGFARRLLKYDDRGNVVEGIFFGPDGLLISATRGMAESTEKEKGPRKRLNATEEEGQTPLTGGKDGIAKWKARYDDNVHRIETAYFGTDGLPIADDTGVARIESVFDERGFKTQVRWIGVDGKPTLNKFGRAKVCYTYDDRGNEREQAWFGVDGLPIADGDGVCRIVSQFDAFTLALKESRLPMMKVVRELFIATTNAAIERTKPTLGSTANRRPTGMGAPRSFTGLTAMTIKSRKPTLALMESPLSPPWDTPRSPTNLTNAAMKSKKPISA